MSRTNQQWSDDADAWYFNLESMAKRIEENEDGHRHARRRQYLILGFVFFAFMLLAYRSEVANDRIDAANQRIEAQQDAACLRGRVILERFNAQQSALAALSRSRNDLEAAVIYDGFVIDPLPTCEDGP